MNYTLTIFAFIVPLLVASSGRQKTPSPTLAIKQEKYLHDVTMNTTIRIKVGKQVFTATLYDNEAAHAFKDLLPLTITMKELNNNEKYYQLAQTLPVNASNPGTIQNGDIMLWGANIVVLFYKTFSTSYSYTQLGKLDHPEGLAKALGSGNITVTFE